jgi:hypothetical protein
MHIFFLFYNASFTGDVNLCKFKELFIFIFNTEKNRRKKNFKLKKKRELFVSNSYIYAYMS